MVGAPTPRMRGAAGRLRGHRMRLRRSAVAHRCRRSARPSASRCRRRGILQSMRIWDHARGRRSRRRGEVPLGDRTARPSVRGCGGTDLGSPTALARCWGPERTTGWGTTDPVPDARRCGVRAHKRHPHLTRPDATDFRHHALRPRTNAHSGPSRWGTISGWSARPHRASLCSVDRRPAPGVPRP